MAIFNFAPGVDGAVANAHPPAVNTLKRQARVGSEGLNSFTRYGLTAVGPMASQMQRHSDALNDRPPGRFHDVVFLKLIVIGSLACVRSLT
jgi:hypothetical protein